MENEQPHSSEESSQLEDVRIEVEAEKRRTFLKKRRLFFLINFLVLAEVSLVLNQLWYPQEQSGVTMYALGPIFYFLVALVIGLLVALIPYRNYSYKQKLMMQTFLTGTVICLIFCLLYVYYLAKGIDPETGQVKDLEPRESLE